MPSSVTTPRTRENTLAIVSQPAVFGTDSQHSSFDRIPTLEGWRGVAVLGVIAFHCLQNGQLHGHLWHMIASRGYAGVDIFFALSGFLICGKLLSEHLRTNTIQLGQYYLRRSLRLLPALGAYLVILAILVSVGWVKASGWEFASTLLYVRNYFPCFDGHIIGQYTAHFWSLGVEEHFYLLWPLVMLFIGPKPRRVGFVALTLALGVFVWRTIDSHYGWFVPFGTTVYGKTDTRIDALAWGCLAAVVYPYVQPRVRALSFGRNLWLPIVVVLGAVLFLSHLPGGSLIKAILFPALLMSTAISPTSALGRFLEFRLLKWTGRLSYSIYIWQELLIFPTQSPRSPLSALQHFPANIAFIFLIASASYCFVERPAIQLGRRLGRIPALRLRRLWTLRAQFLSISEIAER